MKTTNPLLAFLIELFQRFGQKSPVFFKVFGWISGIVTALTGIPGFLSMFSIILPAPWDALSNKTAAIAGLVAFFFSNLTVTQATSVAVNPSTNLLPFTAENPVVNKNATQIAKSEVIAAKRS